ncbi:MAG: prolyl oligopeptidase family serine peptidase [Candidatus Limnocylindrales bacterium]
MTEVMGEAKWRARFRAPRTTLPEWATDAPERLMYASNHLGGKWELFAWDRMAGTTRQLTDRREGTLNGHIGPRGGAVWWFDDTDGDEFGRWMFQEFDGSEASVAADELGRFYSTGIELGHEVAVIGGSREGGTSIDVVGDGIRRIYQNAHESWLGGLSADEALLCFHHSEHGDSRHAALRVVDLDGNVIGDLWDGPGVGLASSGFSQMAGDERVLVSHEREDLPRPMLWWPRDGRTRTFELDLPGEIEPSWYPDGSALLFVHEHAGRSALFRLELEPERLVQLPTPPGVISAAAARPDGDVWYLWSDSASPPQVRATSGLTVLTPVGEPAPDGVRYQDLWVDGIHALVAEPAGAARPHPTIFVIHGGPEAHDRDTFSPPVQAWVDHGLCVVMVNYRGSSGYGRAWRDALAGNPGLTELADIAKVHARVLAEGIAQPDCIVLSGASWGGYLTLLGLGKQPDLWSLGVAGVPVADYFAAYEDEMEPLKAYDRALFGASPQENPQAYRDRNALSFTEDVRVPVMVLAGANDPRCPIRQIEIYLDRLTELGKPHEVLKYDAGHGSLRTDERIRQLEAEINFVARHLGTQPAQ